MIGVNRMGNAVPLAANLLITLTNFINSLGGVWQSNTHCSTFNVWVKVVFFFPFLTIIELTFYFGSGGIKTLHIISSPALLLGVTGDQLPLVASPHLRNPTIRS